jgi:hypothetical protein
MDECIPKLPELSIQLILCPRPIDCAPFVLHVQKEIQLRRGGHPIHFCREMRRQLQEVNAAIGARFHVEDGRNDRGPRQRVTKVVVIEPLRLHREPNTVCKQRHDTALDGYRRHGLRHEV